MPDHRGMIRVHRLTDESLLKEEDRKDSAYFRTGKREEIKEIYGRELCMEKTFSGSWVLQRIDNLNFH